MSRIGNDITAVILAGGRATRMGEVDKGLQLFRSQSMVAQILYRLQPQVGTILINANRNLEAYRVFACELVPDIMPDFAGPLAGIHAALQHCRTPFLATLPCDSPCIPDDLIAKLYQALQDSPAQLAVVTTTKAAISTQSADHARHRQPVFSLMRIEVAKSLVEFLSAGGRKVDAWHSRLSTLEVAFDDAQAFANINTYADLERLELTPPTV
jgi:molybdenum cofactor guanylyltransferase